MLIALACSALVLASFSMFARDQIDGASKHQQQEIAGGLTHTPPITTTKTGHSQPRRFIDSAARALTSPFRSIVQSDSQWVLHAIPTIVALLVYGLGLAFLARYSRGLT
jgi:hypothetical protein